MNWGVGRYLLLASAFLCLGEYLGLRTLKRSRTPAQVVLMFLLAHVSIVSFLFDLPGLFIGSRASLVVICLNIIAFIYLLCAIIFALDYNTAWGCYGLHTKIKGARRGTLQRSVLLDRRGLHQPEPFSVALLQSV